MAFLWSRQAGTALLMIAVLGGGGAQGSGSHLPAGHAPHVAVLGVTELPVLADHDGAMPWHAAADAGPTADAAPTADAGPTADPGPTADAEPTADAADPATTSTAAAVSRRPAAMEADEFAAATLASITYPWRDVLPGWQMSFRSARPGVRGMTFPQQRLIEIYVRDTDTPSGLARVVAHEIGHAIDVQHNDAAKRARWRAARGAAPTVPWWPSEAADDFATLAGDFAEAFAVWQLGVESRSTLGETPTPDQLAVLASLVP